MRVTVALGLVVAARGFFPARRAPRAAPPPSGRSVTAGADDDVADLLADAFMDEQARVADFARAAVEREGGAPAPEGAEGPHAAEYWYDPRIHEWGNIGLSGQAAAALAPLATLAIDALAYNGENLRATACEKYAAARRARRGTPPVRRVVDLGCGTGPSARALAAAWPEASVTALDTSEEMLRVARLTTPRTAGPSLGHRWTQNVDFRRANAERTGLEANGYDVVSVQFVLHEAPRDGRRAILAEARRLLAPGGALLLLDLARGYAPSAQMLAGEPYVEGYLRHIEEDVRDAGFEDVTVEQPIAGRAEIWTCHAPAHGAPEPAAARAIGPVLEFDEWDAVVRNVISADV